MEAACQLACGRAVDGWFTCDHIHFLRIAKHRTLELVCAGVQEKLASLEEP